MFIEKIGIAPEIMKDIFEIDERPYNLRHGFLVKRHSVRQVRYGIETTCFLAPKSWNTIHGDCKNVTTLSFYKEIIKVVFLKTIHVEYANLHSKRCFFMKSQRNSETFISFNNYFYLVVFICDFQTFFVDS